MKPQVSVVIPTFNRFELLSQALQSVLEQTYKDMEIVVVDDGSNDNTREKLEDYVKKYGIRYVYQKNQGLPSARNTGILKSSGRYIAVLDDDDLWYPYTVEKQVNELGRYPDFGMVYSDVMMIDEKGNELGLRANRLLPSGDIYEEVTSGRVLCLMGTIMVRRNIVDEIGMFDPELKRYQDVDFVRKVAEKNKIKFIDVPLVKYRKHPNAMTAKKKYDLIYIKKRFQNIFVSERFSRMNKNFQADIHSKYFFQLGKGYFQLSRHSLARKYFLKSIYCSPKRLKSAEIYRSLARSVLAEIFHF